MGARLLFAATCFLVLAGETQAQTLTVARIYRNANLAGGLIADEKCGTAGNFDRVKAANKRLGLPDIGVGRLDQMVVTAHEERANFDKDGKSVWCTHWNDILVELENTPPGD